MAADVDATGESSYGERTMYLLGAAYLLIGVGLLAAMVVGSVELMTAVLIGILGVTLVSLVVIVRHEGVVTPENKMIATFVVLAIALLFVLDGLTDLSREAVFAVVFVVGVLVPHLLLSR